MSLDFILKHEDIKPRGAVLLFHGLTGSPFELKKYGQFLYEKGYDVFAESLPGHGERVKEIYTVKYQDWLSFGYSRFERLKSQYDKVFISGICLGAVLTLAVAERYGDRVSGIIPLSTTLFLDGWRLPFYSFLIPIALSTILRFYYSYPECEPHGIKNERVRSVVKKLLQKGDVGMNDFPMTAIYELLKLSKFVRKSLSSVVAPALIIHSQEDDLTSVKSANLVYNSISSEENDLIILNNSYHMVLYDNEKEFVYEKVLKFLNEHAEIKEESLACC